MADTPNSSASQSNIDDLVRELSRPQGSPAVSDQSSAPRPATSAPATAPTTSAIPHPVAPVPVSPAPVSGSMPPKASPIPPSPAPSAPKEYQSSIRTMNDDLAKIKAGQAPQGVNIPRKIDDSPATPKPVTPSAPPVAPSRPSATITMPSATKSGSLPANPNQSSVSSSPAPTPIPRPVMPQMPAATKNTESKIDQKNQFYVPPTEAKVKTSGSRNIIFVGIAIALVVFGSLYWYFMIRDSADQTATESPAITFTPRPTATPNTAVLSTIFTNRGGAIVLPESGDPKIAFNNAISAQPNISPGTFTTVDIISGPSSKSQSLSVTGLMSRFLAAYPADLQSALGKDYKFMLYGQKESFDSKGKPIASPTASSRFVIVSEIASSSSSILQGWEATMDTSLAGIMGITPSANTKGFATTNYKGTTIHFKNFPYPDKSIDYALLQYNNKTYLIVAGSREAMFAAIDSFSGSVLGK